MSNVTPIKRRATSQRAVQNAAAIMKALTQEAIEAGLDGITTSSVAKRAGLSTGALYSRYENTDEMMVALWQQVVAPELQALIMETVEALTTRLGGGIPPLLAAQLEKPSRILGLGAECIVVAQRNEVIGEVVIADVSKWLRDAGLHTTKTPLERAGAALGASIALGACLRSFITTTNPSLGLILVGLRNAFLAANANQQRTKIPPPSSLIRADTGSALRDALIDATAEVMSKTGFNGATISRIARKSGVSIGSIYNFYPDKETLMNDAISELLRTQQTQILEAKRTATTAHRQNFGLTDSFQYGLVPSRRTWLRFRQECIIASRHHRKTSQQMERVMMSGQQTMADTFSTIDRSIINLLSTGEQAIGLGYVALFGYSNLLDKCDFEAVMVQVARQNNL